ncbi:MAG TPA: tetratricopeptide repeat protein [Vicinamibacterales bacterium]|nr:tetratricopeptide repeat protein [Vicinamibacterales bacterium]
MRFVFASALIMVAIPALAQVPATPQQQREAYQQYQRGQELLSSEQYDRAAEAFQSATKLDPNFTDAYYGLGKAYMGLQRYSSAIDAYENCIEAARRIYSNRERDRAGTDQQITDQIRALRETIIAIRRQKTGQIENQVLQVEARIRELERSKSSMSGPFEPPAEVLLSLGSAHFRNGNADGAQQHWEQAVKVNSKLGEAWNNLAVIYMRAGRKTDAETAVKNAEKSGFRVNPRLKDDIRRMTS